MTDELRTRLSDMSTDELVAILRFRDQEQWRPEVFPLVEAILKDRGLSTADLTSVEEVPADIPELETLESIASFPTALEANLCRMALQEAEIDAWLSTEHLAGVAPPLGLAIGVDVMVRPSSVEAAREILSGIQDGVAALPEDREVCPRCSSTDTEHQQTTDRVATVSGWLLASMPLAQHVWRWKCRACGYEWE